jgi:dynein heavy chain
MQDVLETLDPALEPVLSKSIQKQGVRLLIQLGDKELDYNPDFRFYLTTVP